MEKYHKYFLLTPEQEKIVLPEIKKAERAHDKEKKPGFIFGQMWRNDRQGDIFATAVFIEKEWSDRFMRLKKKYDKYLESKEANPKK